MTKIKGKAKGQLDVKRFYVPGVKIESNCPKCGTKYVKDLSSHYFFEPSINKAQAFHFECEQDVPEAKGGKKVLGLSGDYIFLCKEEWSVKLKFDITVSEV